MTIFILSDRNFRDKKQFQSVWLSTDVAFCTYGFPQGASSTVFSPACDFLFGMMCQVWLLLLLSWQRQPKEP